ncbi:MAG: type IV pilus modification protein PilV [Betaproteobacteria bacterium]|nr:type IV pilus modification protein PilV [Betaproteobacteria bacterium]
MLNRGFTLIEVLVTLVILMFGLLGIAGLMAKGQKASFEAYQRQAALAVANDMVERMRLNTAQSTVYSSGATVATPTGLGVAYNDLLIASITNCGATACTAAELAAYDLALWDGLLQGYGERNAGGGLVGGIVNARGCIEELANTLAACPVAPAAPGNFYTRSNRISVSWQGNEDTVAPTTTNCGTTLYGTETRRRVVSLDMMLQIACP